MAGLTLEDHLKTHGAPAVALGRIWATCFASTPRRPLPILGLLLRSFFALRHQPLASTALGSRRRISPQGSRPELLRLEGEDALRSPDPRRREWKSLQLREPGESSAPGQRGIRPFQLAHVGKTTAGMIDEAGTTPFAGALDTERARVLWQTCWPVEALLGRVLPVRGSPTGRP